MDNKDKKSLAKWPVYIYILFGVATGVFLGLLTSTLISEYVFYQYFAPAPSNSDTFNFEYLGYGFGIMLVCMVIFAFIVGLLAVFIYRKNRDRALSAAPSEAKKIQKTGLVVYILIAIAVSVVSILVANEIFDKNNVYHPPSQYCNKGYTSAYAKYECESSK